MQRGSWSILEFQNIVQSLEWRSKKQECVGLLTTEAQYISLCTAAKEVVWLRGLLDFLRAVQRAPTVIYDNNRSTIALVGRGQTSRRTKHIEVRFHYTRDKIADKTIQVEYCPTNKMIANGLTKALALE